MKRTMWCSAALALGLCTWTAQGQQNDNPNPNNAQQNPAAQSQPNNNRNNNNASNNNRNDTNRNNNQPSANQAGTNNSQPNVNTNAQAPNTNANVNANPPAANVQAPNVNANVNANPGAAVQAGTAGAAVGAQAANAAGTLINGRIVRMGQNQYVVQGVNGQQYTFYTNPQTSYWMNNNPAQWSNLQVGSNVSTWYTPQNGQYQVNRVQLYPAGAAFPPAPQNAVVPAGNPAPAPGAVAPAPAVAAPATPQVYEGTFVRMVNANQMLIRTSDGKDVIVNVTPQTNVTYDSQPATVSTFQPGYPVRVNYYEDNGRPYARGILGLRRR